MYLSSIQNGIQSAHCLHELFRKYERIDTALTILGKQKPGEISKELSMVYDWADHHKTMIVTNGGYSENLELVLQSLEKTGYPFAYFREPGIGNALTCIGVILPEMCYNNPYLRFEENVVTEHDVQIETGLNPFQWRLAKTISKFPLAR